MTKEEFIKKNKGMIVSPELQKTMDDFAGAWRAFLDRYQTSFDETKNEFENYLLKNGKLIPKDINAFMNWASIIYPDAPIGYLVTLAKNPYSFKMYHDYRERCHLNNDWSDEKEFEFLQNEIAEPQQNITSKLIYDLFEQGTKNGWQDIFNIEDDYHKFVGILTEYFEFKKLNINDISFKLKRTTKTKTASILRDVHKNLSNIPLKSDFEFFRIIKLLHHFKDDPDNDIYKALIK
ncbi:hypothetical protein B0A69_20415 [Chryseobacterium shigense]|uniref:Uncharacterized protein n=1 Tax=Chryseobacterium shigense TaxID=297244 RepID=A0A1N7I0W2_9FLAO|nr:hypothetical protein [Chryseobacterium shigense]PQA90693.1 hypothetical protein B0A69_20415 [Chryseobacterium shigense]SIS30658.1 hypothetical protein SAMN05421639_101985 [Chryseobacterium shigense]